MERAKSIVYVLSVKDFTLVKIGSTTAPKMRFKNIQTACPYDLFLWLSISTLRRKELENYLHSMFSQWRARGEWFRLPEEQLDLLRCKVAELNEMERKQCTISKET